MKMRKNKLNKQEQFTKKEKKIQALRVGEVIKKSPSWRKNIKRILLIIKIKKKKN